MTDPLTRLADNPVNFAVTKERHAGYKNSEVYKGLEEQGIDPIYAWYQDKVPAGKYDDINAFDAWAPPPGRNPNAQTQEKGTIPESDLVNADTSYGKDMRQAGAIMVNYLRNKTAQRPVGFVGNSPTPGQVANIVDSVSTTSGIPTSALSSLDKMSDKDHGQFMLEFLGQNEHNMSFGAGVWLDTDNMPPEVLAALAGSIELYDQLPTFSWSGSGRLVKGVLGDLSTYVGLSSLAFVKNLLAGGSKQIGKGFLRDRILKKLYGSAFVGVEGSGYAAMMDLFKQKAEAGNKPFVYNKERGALAAGMGFAAGGALTAAMVNPDLIAKGAKAAGGAILDAAKTVGGKVSEFADTMIPAPGQLNMGLPISGKAFKNWFKGSKVVDENKKPLVVYHGTTADFDRDSFEVGRAGGIYFTPDKSYAENFGETGKYHLNFKNPLDLVNNPAHRKAAIKYFNDQGGWAGLDREEITTSFASEGRTTKFDPAEDSLWEIWDVPEYDMKYWAEQQGFDSAIVAEDIDMKIPAYVAFEPGQINFAGAGVEPNITPNKPMTFGGAAAEGSRAHKVPHQLLVEGTGEKADLPVTQAFTPANKQANLQNIDAVHQTNPDALKTSDGWLTAMQRGLGGEFLITPPNQAIKYANDPQLMADKLSKLTPELKAGVDKGFEHVQGIRSLYESGQATEEMTGGLFVWGILSRGAGPVQQEAAFLNIIEAARPFIRKAIDGTFDEKTLIKWQKTVGKYGEVNKLPEGSPARSVTMNVNAAGKLLLELSGTAGNGQNKLKLLHDLLSDPNVSGRELRRQFMEMTDKAGIDNKVVSFTALVAGRNDVLVMDRIQSRHLWDDGQFDGFNIYDGYKKGDTTAKEGLQGVMRGPRGLLLTELLEDGLRNNVNEAYKIAGRPGDASLGRFHWETWVIEGEQAVSHDTLAAVKSGNPIGSSVTEGKRATMSSGTTFIQTKKGMITEYPLSDGGSVYMSLKKQKEFEAFIKKPKNGIVSRDFKVSESTDIPWYEQPGVDRSKLDAAAKKHANRRPDGTVLKSSRGTK